MNYLVCKLETTPRGVLYLSRGRPVDKSQEFTNKKKAIRFARSHGNSGLSVVEVGRGGIPFDGPFKIVWPKSPC